MEKKYCESKAYEKHKKYQEKKNTQFFSLLLISYKYIHIHMIYPFLLFSKIFLFCIYVIVWYESERKTKYVNRKKKKLKNWSSKWWLKCKSTKRKWNVERSANCCFKSSKTWIKIDLMTQRTDLYMFKTQERKKLKCSCRCFFTTRVV